MNRFLMSQRCYLRAVCSDGDSEQEHGHRHPHHHADQDEMARVAVDFRALLYK